MAAIECRYGGELYDPNLLAPVQAGIVTPTSPEKAYGFSPAARRVTDRQTGNGSADLLCQYF